MNAGVTFRWKDYRASGKTRDKAMTLSTDEFIRRFLPHVLPAGFHRIRHYGLLAQSEMNVRTKSSDDTTPTISSARLTTT